MMFGFSRSRRDLWCRLVLPLWLQLHFGIQPLDVHLATCSAATVGGEKALQLLAARNYRKEGREENNNNNDNDDDDEEIYAAASSSVFTLRENKLSGN
ncbi:hypothetical protein F2P81_016470 [Scophthalmus maximus]|uniref:Secreted protein n=1 Tax=Scophthalmus maximus TaxID=52904 RepID=A0A6A4SH26_SCOMX|nr:hypothetical protein F2P81_016470 [Scophthalmus maximus]